MFISNKEKVGINEKLGQHKSQIENLVKHVGKLQVDVMHSDVTQIPVLVESNKSLSKSYWAHISKFKTLEKSMNSLQVSNELLLKKSQSLTEMFMDFNKRLEKLEAKKSGRPVGAKNKVVIPAEKVQEMKDSGAWDDPKLRIFSIDKFIKEEREMKEQRKIEKRREAGRRYYAKKKAKQAAQKELL